MQLIEKWKINNVLIKTEKFADYKNERENGIAIMELAYFYEFVANISI